LNKREEPDNNAQSILRKRQRVDFEQIGLFDKKGRSVTLTSAIRREWRKWRTQNASNSNF